MTKPLLALVTIISALLTYVVALPSAPTPGAALPQAVAVFETSLAAPITSSATTMTLTANSIRGGGALSGYNCFTIDEGSAQAETTCGTISGTSVTGLSRGISQSTGTTTVAALQFAHRRGANVKITDFPILQILKAQANGEDTYPNLLNYKNTVLIDAGSASTTIATKYYVDSVSVAGASDANTTTKGIVELATPLEAASSTSAGATGALLVLPSSMATDTPQYGCAAGYTGTAGAGCSIVASLAGKIKQAWLDIFGTNNTWTGTNTFGGADTFNATATFNVAPVFGTFSATSTTATSSIAANLTVGNNASTTNLTISNTCVHCTRATIRTGTQTGPSTTGTTATATASCTGSEVLLGGGGKFSASSVPSNGNGAIMYENYPSDATTWSVSTKCSNGAGCTAGTISAYAICGNP